MFKKKFWEKFKTKWNAINVNTETKSLTGRVFLTFLNQWPPAAEFLQILCKISNILVL